MEKSAEEETLMEVKDDCIRHSERKPVRRRLIQSTLFPHRSPDHEGDGEEEEDVEEEEEEEEGGEDEEYCGSKSKSKRKRKGKGMTQSRAAKKAPVMGKEIPSQRTENRNIQGTVSTGADFFLKVSERRLQKKQHKEQQQVDSLEGNNKTCTALESVANKRSPRQRKEKCKGNSTPCKDISPSGLKTQHCRSPRQLKKRQGSTTPCKDITPSCLKGPHCRQISTNPNSDAAKDGDIHSEHIPQSVPDLWLEAKITAEENARLFAGRQTHPFFSSLKVGKRSQETLETIDMDSKWCSVSRKDKNIFFGPIHVSEMLQDDLVSLDWGNWILCERTLINSSCAPENACSSVFEGSVEPLNFDNFLTISNSIGTSVLQNEVSLDQSPSQGRYMHPMSPTASSMLADGQVALRQQLKYLEVDPEKDYIDFLSRYTGCVSNSDIEQGQDSFLQERMRSYYLDCDNQPDNILWTNKYQPEKASEVCGNGQSVRFLNEWLCCWHEREFRASKDSAGGDKCIIQGSDYSCGPSDSDTENIDGGANIKNVLLVTGPVGSGKSAAIYACAKEQGFQVIEVNASDWRNGALVKQRFGEAVESHWLKRSLEDHVDRKKRRGLEISPAQLHSTAAQENDDEVIELISTDEEESENAMEVSGNVVDGESRTACNRGEIKTLILFEDVDTIFDEDRGFISTVKQLAETAKRPMILTSNSKDPVLPDHLDRLELCFTVPSPKELLSHVYMVCAAEKADIQPQLIKRFIDFCQGDIRKTIMLFQFWCQGKWFRKDRKLQHTYGPLQFDLDAGHSILPKIIPWEFPSQLSELVEKEITKSLSTVKENTSLMGVVEEEDLNSNEMQDALEMGNNETDIIKAKKESMLNMHCSSHDGNDISVQFDCVCDFSNSSGSPVAFTRRTVRRPGTVMSSDSEDEFRSSELPVMLENLSKDANGEVLLDVSGKSLSQMVATQDYLDPLTDQLSQSEGENPKENHFKYSGTASDQPINTCKSVDISCVPESSFVPETEINNGVEFLSRTVSCGHVPDFVEEVSLSNGNSIQNLSLLEVDNLEKAVPSLHHKSEISGRPCDVDAESVHGDEEIGDSQNEDMEAVMRGCQVLDECSRMDFNKGCISVENPRSGFVADSVQQTWRKLRGSCTDLRPYVNSEEKDASRMMELAYRMSNIISETELLLGCCQPPISDSSEPPMVPCVELDAFCWNHEQLEMTSIIAQHGLCFYAKESSAVGSNIGFENRVDLAWEMLTSTSNTMALGKLVTQDTSISQTSCAGRGLEMRPLRSAISLKSEVESQLYSAIQSLVPSRSYLEMRGAAFHEYVSSLGQISRSEASRLANNIDKTKKRRRARVAGHYLSTGAQMLSPEDVQLLAQRSCYGKVAMESMDASFR